MISGFFLVRQIDLGVARSCVSDGFGFDLDWRILLKAWLLPLKSIIYSVTMTSNELGRPIAQCLS